MILEPSSIEQLTKRQRRVLNKLDIPYRVRPDNSLVVFIADLNKPCASRPTVKLLRNAAKKDTP